jgi:hypothetical protein
MQFTCDLAKDTAQIFDPQAFRTNLTYDSNAAASLLQVGKTVFSPIVHCHVSVDHGPPEQQLNQINPREQTIGKRCPVRQKASACQPAPRQVMFLGTVHFGVEGA